MRALGAQVLFLRHPDYILLPSGGPDRVDEVLGVQESIRRGLRAHMGRHTEGCGPQGPT